MSKLTHSVFAPPRLLQHLLAIGVLLLAIGNGLHAASIDPDHKYAWSGNAGWINHRASHGVVSVYADHLEGYAWGENIGWVKLGSHSGGGAHSYANSSADDWGVNNDGAGNLSGYGWSPTTGWINFNPSHAQVTLDPDSGDFDGYGWSENIGWIHFNHASAPIYKVAVKSGTEVDPFSFTDQNNVPLNTPVTSDSVTLSIAGSGSAAVNVTGGEYQINGSGPWTTAVGTANHGETVRVRHTSANNFNTQTDTKLTVGNASDTFTSTTVTSGTSYSGQTATGSGGATAVLSGGGANCVFTNARFVPLSAVPEPAPNGYDFPHGLFDFTADHCDENGTITVTITYATTLNPGTHYWKYGPTSEGPDGRLGTDDDGQSHWYLIDAAVVGSSVSFSITDGARGDDDLTVNGKFVDQGGPGVFNPVVIPTLNEWSRLLLAILVAVFGAGALGYSKGHGPRRSAAPLKPRKY